ncbi:MAG: YbaB/EbfC family nucleoid-associated protein [Thermodesulfobacteriota bacterium]|nr:YbaB/EbfC family nucleoid-associated protein [Deltaproteobacteria bacterium TMED58]RZP15778.1 MAG: YbaB/EbfC family nucleoid-associated protein [Candidatus Dadabacteria bacterium]|tara:strand:+ start:135 stop:458 length:324 start_codon:yes stop_codon:yes gene_type:complete
MKMPGNMKSMMKQAEKMKVQMDKLQEEAGNKTLEITAGGGMVKVTAKCNGEILSIHIEDEIISSGDKEMLQDLIQVAINEALAKGKEEVNSEMSRAATSLGIPPGFL